MTSFSSNFTDQALPSTEAENWPHRPVCVRAGSDTKVIGKGIDGDAPVPLGVPFEIESPLFKGKVLLRFRSADSNDPKSHAEYFEGRKRLMQTVVQGRFKRPVRMSDVYAGSLFVRPLAGAPPHFLADIMDAVIRRVAPGLILDLSSDDPKVICLLAGSAQSMSIDAPGEEPDITKAEIEENVASRLGDDVGTKVARRQVLGDPVEASRYEFGTESVYTFHSYDDAMDYGRGTMHIPMYGEYDIKPSIGRQPLSLTAVTKSGDILYDFRIWHESHQHEEEW